MKKLTLALSVLAVLGAASCKKDDKKSSGNSWTIDDKSYSAVASAVSSNVYSFSDGTGNGMVIQFYATPAAGTYTVVNGAVDPKANEVGISTVNASPVSTGLVQSGQLTVTGSGEELTFKASGLSIEKRDATATVTGTGVFSCDVTY